jgi:hypothetical protein
LLAANVLARPAPGRARAPLQSEPLANMTLVGSLLGLEEAQVAEISASRLMLYEHSSVPGANKVVQTRFMNLLEKTP